MISLSCRLSRRYLIAPTQLLSNTSIRTYTTENAPKLSPAEMKAIAEAEKREQARQEALLRHWAKMTDLKATVFKKLATEQKKIHEEMHRKYSLKDGIPLVRSRGALPDEILTLYLRLGIDPKKPEHFLRGSIALPYGTGNEVRILVFAKDAQAEAAKAAGANYVGAEELIEKIQAGWLDFDQVLAEPKLMPLVAKVGKFLGPKNLMPNPKMGTVTNEIKDAVLKLKRGQAPYRIDKDAVLNIPVGKVSFPDEQLRANIQACVDELKAAQPKDVSKGFFAEVKLTTPSMAREVKLDVGDKPAKPEKQGKAEKTPEKTPENAETASETKSQSAPKANAEAADKKADKKAEKKDKKADKKTEAPVAA